MSKWTTRILADYVGDIAQTGLEPAVAGAAANALIDLVDGRADLGGAQGDQLQIPAGQFADLLGKPLDALVFRTFDRGQRSQHPGHLIKALKEVAHRALKNPAQARQGLNR